MQAHAIHRFALATAALTLVVIVFGAYVRLSHAGLSCPDWPTCYGRVDVPSNVQEIEHANRVYPERPLVPSKAWKEMTHRYLAALLGLAILALAVFTVRARRTLDRSVVRLSLGLVALVVFQALLGMWTVTLLVKPAIVTLHLVGGLSLLSLLTWFVARLSPASHTPTEPSLVVLRPWVIVGLAIVVAQIVLGGWNSSNYAALSCTSLPGCDADGFWPTMRFDAFRPWSTGNVDHEYGVLDADARSTIHMVHRAGALVTFIYVVVLSLVAWRRSSGLARRWALAACVAVVAQLAIGIAVVGLGLPLAVAALHNAGAAFLTVTMVALLHAAR